MKFFLRVILIIFVLSLGLPVRAESNLLTASSLVGPRQNIASSTPIAYGFWSFSVVKPTILSRSGQPTIKEFGWLRQNGWQAVVDLRFEGEYKEVADDAKLPGFRQLGFNYLRLPIRDGQAPTEAQAKTFLKFVQDPKNQPLHIHCRGGYGRTGTLVALYRFEVDGWSMTKAIAESRLYHGGVSAGQKKWLLAWEKKAKLRHK